MILGFKLNRKHSSSHFTNVLFRWCQISNFGKGETVKRRRFFITHMSNYSIKVNKYSISQKNFRYSRVKTPLKFNKMFSVLKLHVDKYEKISPTIIYLFVFFCFSKLRIVLYLSVLREMVKTYVLQLFDWIFV